MNLKRIKVNDITIYVEQNTPFYFVPNQKGDILLQSYLETKDIFHSIKQLNLPISKAAISSEQFLKYIESKFNNNEYSGRFGKIDYSYPKEVWIHLTNRCNLNCTHCLFSNYLNNSYELDYNFLINKIKKLNNLGTNIFIFTGGEPLIYKNLPDLIKFIHKNNEFNKVAILTNGLLIENFYKKIKGKVDFERIHFQISCEGVGENYKKVRGKEFSKFLKSIKFLIKNKLNFAVAIDIFNNNFNIEDFEFLANNGVKNFHFFYHIPEGNGKNYKVDVNDIFKNLKEFYLISKKRNLTIDNFYALETQIFTFPKIKHDLSSAGIESIAIGPDYKVYPTAATVFQDKLICGDLKKNEFIKIWEKSELLNKIRKFSVINFKNFIDDPFKFFHGGGDLDLSYFCSGKIFGYDPFIHVYNEIFKMLICEEVKSLKIIEKDYPEIIFEQGDKIKDCGKKGEIFLTHSNCLLSFSTKSGLEPVQSFYKKSAVQENKDILNPFINNLKNEDIPEENLKKSYGCGSPVNFADIKEGTFLLDLGSGSGVETLIASELVGDDGLVVGIDMLDEMLELSNKARYIKNRGNLYYLKSYIENIPFKSNSFDIVISNCVINLSNEKRKVFSEIFRVLKAGGKFIISDVVSEKDLPISFLQDDKLKGECLSGSLTEKRLFNMLKSLGFKNINVISRVLYKIERGFRFFSLTFSGIKPSENENFIYYPGEFSTIITDDFDVIHKGEIKKIKDPANDRFYILDNTKAIVTNFNMEVSCDVDIQTFHETGCLICGKPLIYHSIPVTKKCKICGKEQLTNNYCEKGHFICDSCHQKNPLILMEKFLYNSTEQDLIKLFVEIRNKAKFPMHGPEYHALIPGIILVCFRNCGGKVTDFEIKMAIDRGKKIPGGSCGFMGICGVATGVGIAISVITKATPLRENERSIVLSHISELSKKFAKYNGARCCQRESLTGLKYFSKISEKLTGIYVPAEMNYKCEQYLLNKNCIKNRCPFYTKL